MPKDKNVLAFPFEVKNVDQNDDGEMLISGKASTFGNIDHYGDVIEPGAFKKTLKEKAIGKVKFLWQHNAYEPIGVIKELSEDEDGLNMTAQFIDTQRGLEAYKLAKAGALDSFSIGFRCIKSRKGDDELRYLQEIDLWEVSLVTFPANPKAMVDGIKQAQTLDYIESRLGLTQDEAKRALDILLSNPEKTKQALSLGSDRADSKQEEAALEKLMHSLERVETIVNQ